MRASRDALCMIDEVQYSSVPTHLVDQPAPCLGEVGDAGDGREVDLGGAAGEVLEGPRHLPGTCHMTIDPSIGGRSINS